MAPLSGVSNPASIRNSVVLPDGSQPSRVPNQSVHALGITVRIVKPRSGGRDLPARRQKMESGKSAHPADGDDVAAGFDLDMGFPPHPGRVLRDRRRLAEQITLDLVAGFHRKEAQLVLRLAAFGNDGNIEAMAEPDP